MDSKICPHCGGFAWRMIAKDHQREIAQLQREITQLRTKLAGKFDKVAYQRDYMRRYRAKKRGLPLSGTPGPS